MTKTVNDPLDTDDKLVTAEWTGYVNGLEHACNMRPTIPFGSEGANVWENIRTQIVSKINEVMREHGI